MNSDRFFLLVRDRHKSQTSVDEFCDASIATAAYADAERRYRAETLGEDPAYEIVLIAAESLAAVEDMYPHYFTSGDRDKRREDLLAAL